MNETLLFLSLVVVAAMSICMIYTGMRDALANSIWTWQQYQNGASVFIWLLWALCTIGCAIIAGMGVGIFYGVCWVL